jgi:hypothetical protein
MEKLLNLDHLPDDAIERLAWLGGVLKQVHQELEPHWREAYFESRLTGRLDDAENLRLHSHKRIMAWTRGENESRGRLIRWGDRRA